MNRIGVFLLAAGGLFMPSSRAAELGTVPAGKQEKLGGGHFALKGAKVSGGESAREQEIAQVLAEELNRRNEGAGVTVGGGGNIVLRLGGGPEKKEGYKLSVTAQGITLEARDPEGLFWGAATVLQLSDGGQVPAAEIEDYPDLEFRALHLNLREPNRDRYFDDSQGKIPKSYYGKSIMYSLEWLKNFARECGLLKLNYLVFECDDKVQWSATPDKRHDPSLTPEQVKEWCAYAAKYNVKICPMVNAPGHAHWYTSHGREGYGGRDKGYRIDVKDEKTQKDFQSIVEEECQWFSGDYVHLAADETGGAPEFLTPLFEIVKKHNKKAIVWAGPSSRLAQQQGGIVMRWGYGGGGKAGRGEMGAGGIWSNGAGHGIMGYGDRSGNVYGWARNLVKGGAIGMLTTVWMNWPGPSFEGLWEQIHMAAQASWGPNHKPGDYGLRFAKQFFGVAEAGPYEAYGRLYATKHGGTRSYFYLSAGEMQKKRSWHWDADKYLAAAEALQTTAKPLVDKVKRNQNAAKFLEWYGQFLEFQALTKKAQQGDAEAPGKAKALGPKVKEGFKSIWGYGMTGQCAIDCWLEVIDARLKELEAGSPAAPVPEGTPGPG